MKLILASKSPRRKEILERFGFDFEICVKETEESINPKLNVYQNAMLVARKKGEAVFKECPNDVVLSTDTMVYMNDVIYGKPKSREDAYNMLKSFSGRTHEVISGVSILAPNYDKMTYVVSFVKFKELTEEMINSYLDTDEPYDKAGSYAIQGIGKMLIEKYTGSLNNIIGLPIEEIEATLKELLK